ncbi:MAG: hypothetical protein RIQ93_371 [Verrucomicrobiota bacterium]
MNHACTYFDRGFLIQGLALWRSLAAHDSAAVLWVLALDDFTTDFLRQLGEARLRVVPLARLERDDPELATARANRTRIEYYFTISPCWPIWLLRTQPEIDRITCLDADLFFFASPAPIFAAMEEARASVLITPHRFPRKLQHYEKHGKFNVGVLSFRNDEVGRSCLEDWRARCLAWCHDRLDADRYADQKYLDAWPRRLGQALVVLTHSGVNRAPWNWSTAPHPAAALVVFHFARFRPTAGTRWWQSGQLDYGIMPQAGRDAIYTPYWRAWRAAREEIAARRPDFDFAPTASRAGREFWRTLPLRVIFGGDWLRIGDRFYNLRFGLGRWSGQCLAMLRTIFLRQ